MRDTMDPIPKSLKVYHGSSASGVQNFKGAEDTTLGEGLYCTSQDKAKGYAIYRSEGGNGTPVVYEIEVPPGTKLADFRTPGLLDQVLFGSHDGQMPGFKKVLLDEHSQILKNARGKGILEYRESIRLKHAWIDLRKTAHASDDPIMNATNMLPVVKKFGGIIDGLKRLGVSPQELDRIETNIKQQLHIEN